MTKHLTKSLIDLRGFGLASQSDSKLCLDHVERGFDIGSLVIALHKAFGVVVIEMVHRLPNRRLSGRGFVALTVRLEGNVRLCMVVINGDRVNRHLALPMSCALNVTCGHPANTIRCAIESALTMPALLFESIRGRR